MATAAAELHPADRSERRARAAEISARTAELRARIAMLRGRSAVLLARSRALTRQSVRVKVAPGWAQAPRAHGRAGAGGDEEPARLIVIGGSAGSLEPLLTLVAGLPGQACIAVLVVLHRPARISPDLPARLSAVASMPVDYARNGEWIRAGRIAVAPRDRHLEIRSQRLWLTDGPLVRFVRPAADVLFRSAADAYGHRSVGIVLSGMVDDGTRGLGAIRDAGGVTIVQDPGEAQHPSMPMCALHAGVAQFCLPAVDMPRLLSQLAPVCVS